MSILWIITDQQRHNAVGYVNNLVKTPNIDQLAESGTVFQCCYAQSPQCHPSRVSMMTGRYPTAHRSWTNSHGLQSGESLLSNMLDMECAYFGKVHLAGDGRDDRKIMIDLGFDYWFTYWDWVELCRWLQKSTDEPIETPRDEFAGIMKTKNWCGKFSRREMHHDEVITEKAIEYLRFTNDFFAVVSYYGPHPPYAAPPPFSEMYDPADMPIPWDCGDRSVGEWQQIKSQYYGNVSWIDDNIRRLLEVVSQDTIVVFTSDHGDILGDHGHFSKGYFGYEGNTRVPLIIRSPDLVARDYCHIAQHIDIVPTLLNLLNIEIPASVQGKSLTSAVNTNTPVNDFALSMIGDDPKMKILRYGDTKYWISDGVEKMFNLKGDPQERELIVDATQLSALRKKLIEALILAED